MKTTKKRTPNQKKAAGKSPAAGSSFLTFNINHYVQVKLTDHGRKCLRENYDRLNASYNGRLTFPFRLPEENAEGWSRWQAWNLMQELGPHIQMGFNPPFETTIRVELKPNEQVENRL